MMNPVVPMYVLDDERPTKQVLMGGFRGRKGRDRARTKWLQNV